MTAVVDTAVMWCATGQGDCDGSEPCHTLCHPPTPAPVVGEFVD